MKKLLLVTAVLSLSLAFASPVQAGMEPATSALPLAPQLNLPHPPILPGSPLYIFKRWWESIRVFTAFDNTAKVQALDQISQERLAEANALIDQGRSSEATPLLSNYSQTKSQESTLLKSIGTVKSSVVEKALANNIMQDSALQVIKDELPGKIDETTVNQTLDNLEIVNEQTIDTYDHTALGSDHSGHSGQLGELPPEVTSSASATPAQASSTSENAKETQVTAPTSPVATSSAVNNAVPQEESSTPPSQIPPQLNSQPDVPMPDSGSSTSEGTTTPSDTTTPSENTSPTDNTTRTDTSQEPVPPDQLYQATDSATPSETDNSTAVQGTRVVKFHQSIWDDLTMFIHSLFR